MHKKLTDLTNKEFKELVINNIYGPEAMIVYKDMELKQKKREINFQSYNNKTATEVLIKPEDIINFICMAYHLFIYSYKKFGITTKQDYTYFIKNDLCFVIHNEYYFVEILDWSKQEISPRNLSFSKSRHLTLAELIDKFNNYSLNKISVSAENQIFNIWDYVETDKINQKYRYQIPFVYKTPQNAKLG